VLLAHGFTQTAQSWSLVQQLIRARGFDDSKAIDLPGHGSASDVRADLWGSADHLVAAGGRTTYIGYSMGGRVSLHAALAHPDVVERLVLIGATAGIDNADDRAQRRTDDELLADRIETIGVEAFIDEWLQNPLFAGLTPNQARREDRLRNTADGLASSLRLAGTGTQAPMWDRLIEINCPVLLLVGQHDQKFRAIAERMATALPNAELRAIDDAGHSVHLEQPERTVDALVDWLTPK
jgi:2-succinyl-6-hydroxy-2,4-cyclohexadiene-1-carboxylate synthase|tara:strand:+ start:3813 stop:4526 length:714 start_codon:yes stop_codon:yes gene_type:complete